MNRICSTAVLLASLFTVSILAQDSAKELPTKAQPDSGEVPEQSSDAKPASLKRVEQSSDPSKASSKEPGVADPAVIQTGQIYQVFQLKFAQAASAVDLLQQLFQSPAITVGADTRTNSILVRGTPESMRELEAILMKLDQPEPAEVSSTNKQKPNANHLTQRQQNQTVPKSQAGLPGLQTSRRGIDTATQPAAELKARYQAAEQQAAAKARHLRELQKQTGAESQVTKLRTELKAAVAAAFSARQQLHQAELLEFQNRALQIQRTIAYRGSIQDQIIERRVDDLLNPDLEWESEGTPAATGKERRQGLNGISPSRYRAEDVNRLPGKSETSSDGVPLSQAVRSFNEKLADHPIGKDQPPLTDDEVVASIRWSLRDQHNIGFATIAESGKLPSTMRLEGTSEESFLSGVGKLHKWQIRLVQGKSVSHTVREQLVHWGRLASAHDSTPKVAVYAPNARPLAGAIDAFNSQYRTHPIGKDQPPLTEGEVIAAIWDWKTKVRQVDLTKDEIEAFESIAETRLLPEKCDLEVLTSFRPNDEFAFDAWSVRIRMPRSSKPGWTYAYTIRDRWIRSQQLKSRDISWGPKAPNGLQAGILLAPMNEQYAIGQMVQPRFFYRNAGEQQLDVSFPRLMTNTYYTALHVVDNSGKDMPISGMPGPGLPVGWIEMPLGPSAQYEINGLPIAIGDVPHDSPFESMIHAKPGQSCRIRFTLPNYGDPKAEPLETGEIHFTVAAETRPQPRR